MHDRTEYAWRISSRSSGGACVEIKSTGDEVLIRDSKDRSGPVLAIEPEVFQAFLKDVKEGRFAAE
jgi:hypothetical protein